MDLSSRTSKENSIPFLSIYLSANHLKLLKYFDLKNRISPIFIPSKRLFLPPPLCPLKTSNAIFYPYPTPLRGLSPRFGSYVREIRLFYAWFPSPRIPGRLLRPLLTTSIKTMYFTFRASSCSKASALHQHHHLSFLHPRPDSNRRSVLLSKGTA